MGSLSSRPDVPAQPQVVYYTPAPAYYAAADSGAAAPQPTPAPAADENAGGARKAGLLQRSRGRFGTVLTGFRGLLDLAGPSAGRKTLLGE